jgi:hypothetical protein
MPIRAINIFRTGSFQSSSGDLFAFTENNLRATAEVYNSGIGPRANVVLGHPEVEHPDETAGPIAALAVVGERLYAIADVAPRFVDLVRRGLFKKVSASFFGEAHPRNPTPGVSYLRHVGLLGAMPPAVTGLDPLEFSDTRPAHRGAAWPFPRELPNRLPSGALDLADFSEGGNQPGFVGVLEATRVIPGMEFRERIELASFVDGQFARGRGLR